MRTHPLSTRCRIKSFMVTPEDRPAGIRINVPYRSTEGEYTLDIYELAGVAYKNLEGPYMFKYERKA